MLPLFDDIKTAPTRAPLIDVEAAFEQLWNAWLRKSGKKNARRKFDQALMKTTFTVLWEAQAWQRHLPQWKKVVEGVHLYVPHLATWLHQERYNDPMPPGFRLPAPPKKIAPVTPEQQARLRELRAHIDHQNHLTAIAKGDEYYRAKPWVPRTPPPPCECWHCVKARQS